MNTTVYYYMRKLLSGIWKGVLGIYFEILFTAAVALAGFLVCAFWWGVSQ